MINENRLLNEANNFFVILGPTGSGKTTLMDSLLTRFVRIKTATTRGWRQDEEPQDAYMWIEAAKQENESIEQFRQRVAEQFDLFETNIFADNVYGTPRQNVLTALKGGRAILGTENHGVKKLIEVFSNEANIVTIFVLPDSFDEMIRRVHGTRNDLNERMETAKVEIEDSKSFVNYYVHNTEQQLYSQNTKYSPLEFTKKNLLNFVNNLMQV